VLLTEHLNRFPAYIRFDPAESEERWQVEQVNVNVNILVSIDPPAQTTAAQNQNLVGGNSLWLGNRMGHYLYLRRTL